MSSSRSKPESVGILSRIGGVFAGLLTGWFTTPVGEFRLSNAKHLYKSTPERILVGAANLIFGTPIRIAYGPLYAAYRGARYGFSAGLAGSMHKDLMRESEEVAEEWYQENIYRKNVLPAAQYMYACDMNTQFNYYSPLISPRSTNSTVSSRLSSPIPSPRASSAGQHSSATSEYYPKTPTLERSSSARVTAHATSAPQGLSAWFGSFSSSNSKLAPVVNPLRRSPDPRIIAKI